MATIGIICEYNPFHNGHLYHLEKIKEKDKDATIILVLGTSFSQRGEISILNKWEKTEIALFYGVDLVIELPFIFATQSADFFAKGAIEILNHLHCEEIVFGSESNNIEELNLLIEKSKDQEYEKIVREYLNNGTNYPTALSKALKKLTNKTVETPNDILAFSYLKQIKEINKNIKATSIKRTNNYHEKELTEKIASATAIRENLKEKKDISYYIPEKTKEVLERKEREYDQKYFDFLKYKILSEEHLEKYQTVEEGLENKIKKDIKEAESLEELIKKVKTKRYTYNKIKRMFTHILCSLTKEEATNKHITYLKVLGFSKKGQEYLNKVKKEVKIPIITKIKKEHLDILKTDLRVTNIYNLITNSTDTDNKIIQKK